MTDTYTITLIFSIIALGTYIGYMLFSVIYALNNKINMKTYIITVINDVTNEIKKVAIATSGGFDMAALFGLNSLKSMGYSGFEVLGVEIAPDNTPIGLIS